MKSFLLSFLLICCLTACSEVTDWIPFSGDSDEDTEAQEVDADEFSLIDIMRDGKKLSVTEEAFKGLSLSPAKPVNDWLQEGGNTANHNGHIKGSLFKEVTNSVTVGDGNSWIRAAAAPSAVVSDSLVAAMDGQGVISVHQRKDISEILWTSDALESDSPILAGGLAISGNRLYAVTGRGDIAAFDTANGKILWEKYLLKPVRSSLRLGEKGLYLVTAESELLVLDPFNGNILWQHRGLGENDSLFGTTLPAMLPNGLVIAYPSGEVFRLNSDNGSMEWNDVLARPRRTQAAGLFSGVDANPVVSGGTVYIASSSGLLVADDVRNGMRLWEVPVGTRHSPAVDEDILFMITDDNQLAALSVYVGQAGWIAPLDKGSEAKEDDDEDEQQQLRYFGPFLINETVIALNSEGTLYQLTALSGDMVRSEEDFVDSVAASPSFAGNKAYIMSHDATLYEVE